MQILRLNRPLEIVGVDFWNRPTRLVIEPLEDQNDTRWLFGLGGREITPKNFRAQGRTIDLVFNGGYALSEFEHIAFLYALGLRGLRVLVFGSTWPPLLCSQELLNQLRERSYVAGELKPYWHYTTQCMSRGGRVRRALEYRPSNIAQLRIRVGVDYGVGRQTEHELCLPIHLWSDTLDKIASSRTFGRPQLLRPVSSILSALPLWNGRRWPHAKKFRWRPSRCERRSWAVEEAKHGMLDKMGIYSFAAPDGYYMAGEFRADGANHIMDVAMVQYIAKQANASR